MSKDKDAAQPLDEFLQLDMLEIMESLEKKNPTAEAFLLRIAAEAGFEKAELFDGTVVPLSE